jgi:hypothetical protein
MHSYPYAAWNVCAVTRTEVTAALRFTFNAFAAVDLNGRSKEKSLAAVAFTVCLQISVTPSRIITSTGVAEEL